MISKLEIITWSSNFINFYFLFFYKSVYNKHYQAKCKEHKATKGPFSTYV